MKTYSVDLRERLLRAIAAGLGVGEAARRFGVGRATIKRWRRQQRLTGTVAPQPKPGRWPKLTPCDSPALAAQVAATPDATLAEPCAQWETSRGVRVSPATMCRQLRRRGLPLKKSRAARPSAMRWRGRPGARTTPDSRRPSLSSSMRRARTPQ